MKTYLLIALGSALGGMSRHWVSTLLAREPAGFPWGTLAVNVVGSFLIGLLAVFPESRFSVLPRPFFTVGLLGGFTTFSAFSLQSVALLENGKLGLAAGYILSSLVLCLAGAWLGLLLGSR